MGHPVWIRRSAVAQRRRILAWVGLATAGFLGMATLGFATSGTVVSSAQVPALQHADPRRAAFVGLAQYEIEFFGLPLVHRTLNQESHAYVIVVPLGQASPLAHSLVPTGAQFAYTDPYGTDWTSDKYTYDDGRLEAWAVPVGHARLNSQLGGYNYVLVFDAGDLGGTEFDLYVDSNLSQ